MTQDVRSKRVKRAIADKSSTRVYLHRVSSAVWSATAEHFHSLRLPGSQLPALITTRLPFCTLATLQVRIHLLRPRCFLDATNPIQDRNLILLALCPGSPWWHRPLLKLSERREPFVQSVYKMDCAGSDGCQFAAILGNANLLRESRPSGSTVLQIRNRVSADLS